MKSILHVAGIVVFAALVFWTGYLFGTDSDFSTGLMNTGLFEDQTNNALENVMILEWISGNESQKAVDFLNMKLNGQILAINNLLPGIKNDGNRKVAKHFFLKAANYRMKYPAEYSDKEIDSMIKEILLKTGSENKD